SEYTPLTAMEMFALLIESGLPGGVANLVAGEADPIGQEMLRHPACAKIHLTGSLAVGKRLLDGASKTMTRLSLELGGNAPVLVFPDVISNSSPPARSPRNSAMAAKSASRRSGFSCHGGFQMNSSTASRPQPELFAWGLG